MSVVQILQKLGFDEKDVRVYMMLLSLGPASVRKLAIASGVNRGTTYDVLKQLLREGLVSFFHKDTKQYFVAEDPAKLERRVEGRLAEMRALKERLQEMVPELQSLYNRGGGKPVARYFEGKQGIKRVLEDVLYTAGALSPPEYCAYSAADVRDELYQSFPNFTAQRIKQKISVKVIALGGGGETQTLAQRKWLTKNNSAPSYTLIYGPKTAHFCMSKAGEAVAVVIEDEGIAQAQKMIFQTLWQTL